MVIVTAARPSETERDRFFTDKSDNLAAVVPLSCEGTHSQWKFPAQTGDFC